MTDADDLNEIYTLSRKYTSRPASTIKMVFVSHPSVKLPQDDDTRIWLLEDCRLVIKTWQYGPLMDLYDMFHKEDLESVRFIYALGPHPGDREQLAKTLKLKCRRFSLECIEHWGGPYVTTLDKGPEVEPLEYDPYSDPYVEPFVSKDHIHKLHGLIGRLSPEMIRQLRGANFLKTLSLRLDYKEYLVFQEVVPELPFLEGLHVTPLWHHEKSLQVPPIRFNGPLTVHYWDVGTTKKVKKAHMSWKKKQGRRGGCCCGL